MRKQSKTLKRAVVVESVYHGKPKLAILGELEEAYKEMVWEAVDYAVENNAKSLAKLHRALYRRLREKRSEMPTRLVKGALVDAVRRAKSFLKLRKQGRAYTGKTCGRESHYNVPRRPGLETPGRHNTLEDPSWVA